MFRKCCRSIAIASVICVILAFFSWNTLYNAKPCPNKNQKNIRYDCPAPVHKPSDRRKNSGVFRIVTFNAEWLFTRGGRGGIKCPGENCTWKTKDQAYYHLARVARVLRELDADLINLNEAEDCAVLQELIDDMGDASLKPYMVRSTDTALGQNVAMLTRIDPIDGGLKRQNRFKHFPVANTHCPKGQSGRGSLSKHYIARIPISSIGIVNVIGVHLLAHPNNAARCARREAQAHIIRDIINSLPVSEQVIVLGDFNDLDPHMDSTKNPTLPVIRGPTGPLQLFNVAALVPRHERYSAWWDRNGDCVDEGGKEHTLIDHVLVSAGLVHRIKAVRIVHGYAATCDVDRRVSDHWPILVEFKTS